jgi:hypothetical protein
MLTSRWVRSLPFLIAFVLAAQAGLASGGPAGAGIFAWMGADGGAALRAAETRDTLGWVRPGLYGPGWTGFTQRTTDAPEQLESGCWRYAGTLIPEGQDAGVDYTVTARGVAGGVELAYAFTAREPVLLNSLHVRVELPVRFAAGARIRFAEKELVLPASYQGRPSLYYAAGRAAELSLAGGIRLSSSQQVQIELEDGREWGGSAHSLSFHLLHDGQARNLPAGSVMELSLRVEADTMTEPVFEPTIESRTDTSGWFAFEMPPDVPRGADEQFEGAVDFSQSIETPAGKHGLLRVEGEHFAFEDGTPAKFWGVNLDSGAGLPDKEHAPLVARRMAQLGINIARFTLDGPAPRGLIARGETTQQLDPEMLDRMDYFVSCLKERGIYVRLDLMHYRVFEPADGVDAPPKPEEIGHWCGGPAMYYQPKVEELHRDFAAKLLLHENPYTGLRYVDDPAMAFAGIVNENSIFFYPEKMTDSGRSALDALYDEWQESHPEGTRIRFLAELERGYYERMYDYLRDIGVKTPIACSNMLMNAPDAQLQALVGDHVEFNVYFDHPHHGYRWVRNQPLLKERGGILPETTAASAAGKPYALTEINFCNSRYRMEAPLITLAYASLQDWDAILWWDYHASWDRAGKYEEFLGASRLFSLKDNPMLMAQFGAASVAFRGGYISPARTRINVKLDDADVFADPNWVWRTGWSAPSPHSPFAVLSLLCQVRSQYENAGGRTPDLTLQTSSADGGDERVIQIADPVEAMESDPDLVWRAVRDTLRDLKLGAMPGPGATTLTSDTHELSWDTVEGVLTIDAERFQAAVGFLAGRRVKLHDFTLDLPPAGEGVAQAPFAAVSFSSLDGKPLGRSSHILLATVGRAEDTGQVWEEDPEGYFAATAGTAPVLAEPVRGRVTWSGRRLKAFPLSAAGKRLGELRPERDETGEALAIGSADTLWYELVPD